MDDEFIYVTTEDLAIELGSDKDEAIAINARVERLSGNNLELVDEHTTHTGDTK